jgi:hypothetical protein
MDLRLDSLMCAQCYELRRNTVGIEIEIREAMELYESGPGSSITLDELWRLFEELTAAEANLVCHAAKMHNVVLDPAKTRTSVLPAYESVERQRYV